MKIAIDFNCNRAPLFTTTISAAKFTRMNTAIGSRLRCSRTVKLFRLSSIIFLTAIISTFQYVRIAKAEVDPQKLDWLRIVPGDVRFYVELSELSKIRDRFLKLGIWRTVRELTEQDASGPTTQPWHERSEEFLGLGPEAAVSRIIGRRCAMIATDFHSVQSGVILAELDENIDVRDLLNEWAAQRLSAKGDVRLYRLRGGILLAVWNRQLVFGTADDPDGLWVRAVALLANLTEGRQGSHLRGRSEFASLAARLEGETSGLLYIAWPDHTEKSTDAAFPSFQRLVAGVSFNSEGIQCRIRAQQTGGHEKLERIDTATLRQLPRDSIAIWSGAFSFDQWGKNPQFKTNSGEPSLGSMLSSAFQLLTAQGADSTAKLGPRITFVVGRESSSDKESIVLPTVTTIIETHQALEHAKVIESVVDLIMRALSLTQAGRSDLKSVKPQSETISDVEARSVQIGDFLVNRTGLSFLRSVQLCWAGDDDRLVLSTSMSHLRSVITALHEKSNKDSLGARQPDILPRPKADLPVVEWTLIRGHEIATMFRSWLFYVQRTRTEALSDAWWQSWAQQRVHGGAKLGVGLADDPQRPGCAVVLEIDPKSPVNGILQSKDIITSIAGRPLARPKSAEDVAARYRARGNTTLFRMQVLRGDKTLSLDIPVEPAPAIDMSDFAPVRALRNLTILLNRVDSITLTRYSLKPTRFDVDVAIHWMESDVKR